MFDLFKKNATAAATAAAGTNWAERLKAGLARTRDTLNTPITELLGGGNIDEAVYEALETLLLTADCGVTATQQMLEDIRCQVSRQALKDAGALRQALRQAMVNQLQPLAQPLDTRRHSPFVILLAGVNGAGKTTTIGKLAWRLQQEGKSVLIAAGDTFRAAAREQLQAWGARNGVHVVAQEGTDPAAVIFDAVNSARAKGIDVVIADTAGRLPTQLHLMEEIRKIQRVIGKALPAAPHEVLLVLDANTGQNAVTQVKAFDDALGVTGLVLTKLDGTAKGGVIAAIARARAIPIRFIGVGEQIDDLQPFDAQAFSEALFS
ncbi:MAG: signal recognition particle-docking protein FtsY [Methylobacterium sp.]|nr:signal recognition particle-docking protein FtsY [Methylobacterium sp.]